MHLKGYEIDGRWLRAGTAISLGIETAGQRFDRNRERRSGGGVQEQFRLAICQR
jgi:hypothetical protein